MDDIRKGNCPLCRHHEIVEAPANVIVPWQMTRRGHVEELPLYAGYRPKPRGFIAAFKRALSADDDSRAGELTVYACRRCGYAQLFLVDAGKLPLDDQHGTRLLEGARVADLYR